MFSARLKLCPVTKQHAAQPKLRPFKMSDYLKAVEERVVIYDGAMGTCVQSYNLPLEEFWGKDGYNDVLVLSRPDVV